MSTASSERSNRRPQLSLIRTQAAQALVPARDLRQATNFAWGIEPRIAPGQRGPTPTSCQMCRKLRSKCFRRNGGRLGEEACVGCRRRGIECAMPQEVTRSARPRNVGPGVAHKAERSLVAREASAQEASGLFEIHLEPGKSGFAVCFMTRFALNLEEMRNKFHSVGRRFDELDRYDQVALRVIWATVSKRNTLVDPSLPIDRSKQLIRTAQEVADAFAIWRKPSLSNFANLFLLYLVLTIDGRPEAPHYLSAAASQFRQLFRTPSDLVGPDGNYLWFTYRFALIDSQLALENGTAPLLSSQDYAVFCPFSIDEIHRLPPPALHLDLGTHSTPLLASLCIVPIRYYLLIAQPLATHFSQTTQTTKHDLTTIEWVWEKVDFLESWVLDSLESLSFLSGDSPVRAVAFSSLAAIYTLVFVLEYTTIEYLATRFDFVSSSTRLASSSFTAGLDDLSSLATLYAQSVTRYEGVICRFIRWTRNLEQVYPLGTSSGFSISPGRLKTLASIFYGASIENEALFPEGVLDKLASTTFLLENLEGDAEISGLQDSVQLLRSLQGQLERATGYSGQQAIGAMISSRPSTVDLSCDSTPYQ